MNSKRNLVVTHRAGAESRQRRKQCRLEKFQQLVDYLERIGEQKFTGYIKINFTQGSIGRIDKFEEILKS